MTVRSTPDVIVYICTNCMPDGASLPRQWQQDGSGVLVREVPCSGKTDGQYLLNVLEAGARGFCVVACPKGECRLVQGNYRAEIRVGTIRRLLAEIGLEPERAQFVHCPSDQPAERLEGLVRDAVRQICDSGKSVLQSGAS